MEELGLHNAEVRADWFRRSEANCRLEGFDASGDAFYQDLKARVIAGALSPEQAVQLSAERWTEAKVQAGSAAMNAA